MKKEQACGLHCIKIEDLGVEIKGHAIIENVNLHIHCGMLTAIIGKNGAGKSTLVKALLGEREHSGSILFHDHENQKLPKLKTGYVPQHVNIEKNTPLSVYDLLASYYSRVPVAFLKSRKTAARIREQLKIFGAEDLIDRQVGSLSGGELQRVLLSMAVMEETNLLILDEPVSGIDKNGMELFYENIDYLKKNYDLAVILVSHDLEYVAKYADEVVLLDKTVLARGKPAQVYHSEAFREVFGNVIYEMEEDDGTDL